MKARWLGKTELLTLTHGKVYEVLSKEHGLYRVVDDSGEDYLYDAGSFEIVEGSEYKLKQAGRVTEDSEEA